MLNENNINFKFTDDKEIAKLISKGKIIGYLGEKVNMVQSTWK